MAVEICVYAAPIIGGTAVVAPEAAIRALPSTGYLLARRPQPVRLAILAPKAPESERVARTAQSLVPRVAATASLQFGDPPAAIPGAQGRSRLAVIVLGALLLLAAGQVWPQVLGGLWLVAGYPLAQRGYVARLRRWEQRTLDGLGYCIAPSDVVTHHHEGLARLVVCLEEGTARGEVPGALYRHLEGECRRWGPVALAPFYAALAAGTAPPAVWLDLPGERGDASASGAAVAAGGTTAGDDGAPPSGAAAGPVDTSVETHGG